MAKHMIWFGVIIATALLQTMWPDFLKIQGALPDLVLIAVVYFAVAEGDERAMFTGLVGGVYLDVASAEILGHHVLGLVIAGFMASRVSTRLITEHPAVKAGLVLFAAAFHGILFTAILYVQKPDIGFTSHILTSVIPDAFYTALLAPVLFFVFALIFQGREAPATGAMR